MANFHNFVCTCLVVIGLILGGSEAFAQATDPEAVAFEAAQETAKKTPPPPTEAGGFFSNLQAAAQQVSRTFSQDVLDSVAEQGFSYAQKFITPALALAGSLALVYLLYETLMYLGSRNGSMLTVLFDVGLPAVTAALLIGSYRTYMDGFNVEVLSLLRTVAGNPTGQIMTFYGSVLQMIGTAISHSFENIEAWDLITGEIAKFGSQLVDFIASLIFSLVILVIVFSSIAEVLGLVLLGPFLYAVSVAFGPFMLAGLVTPWTRDYVGKWLGFLVGSALVTGVLAVIMSIAVSIFESLNFSNFASGRPTALTLGMVAIFVMAVNSLISQAPGIASALIPGGLGVRGGGGHMVTAGAQKLSRHASKAGGVKTVSKMGNALSLGKQKVSSSARQAATQSKPPAG